MNLYTSTMKLTRLTHYLGILLLGLAYPTTLHSAQHLTPSDAQGHTLSLLQSTQADLLSDNEIAGISAGKHEKTARLDPPPLAPSTHAPKRHPLLAPARIRWQGWTHMATNGPAQPTYCIVTVDNTLYTFADRPNPYAKELPIVHTIDLKSYPFVTGHRKHFVLAQTHAATPSHAFTFDQPTTDTLQDELKYYVQQSKLPDKQVDDFIRYLKHEAIDEEALIADMETLDESYLRACFPTVCKELKAFFQQLPAISTKADTLVGERHAGTLLSALRKPHRYCYLDIQKDALCSLDSSFVDTSPHHLVPLMCQIAGDHTACTTLYCLLPRDYELTYQAFAKWLSTYQGVAIQHLTFAGMSQNLRDDKKAVDWALVKAKTLQATFDLTSHFLRSPHRIQFQGWIRLGSHTKEASQHYCMVTDDDKLYLFAQRPDRDKPDAVTATQIIDLATYSYLGVHPDDPNSLLLATTHPVIDKSTAENTLILHTIEPERSLPVEKDDKISHFVQAQQHTFLHILRTATHSYHYLDVTESKKPTLRPLHSATQLETTHYHLVQIMCKTSEGKEPKTKEKPTTNLYCLIPPDHDCIYQIFAQYIATYLRTELLRLTRHDKDVAFEKNIRPINWQGKNNLAFKVTFASTIPPDALYRPKERAEAEASTTDQDEPATQAPQPLAMATHACDYLAQQPAAGKKALYDALRCPIYEYMEKRYRDTSAMAQDKAFKQGLYAHLQRKGISEDTIEDFFGWLEDEKMNEKTIGKDIKGKTSKIHAYDEVIHAHVKAYIVQLSDHRKHLRNHAHEGKRPCPWQAQDGCLIANKWRAHKQLNKKEELHYTCLFDHSLRGKRQPNTVKKGDDLFAYEAEFAQMNKMNLQAFDTLTFLQNPCILLKKLLIEVIDNGFIYEFITDTEAQGRKAKIAIAKYVTPAEYPWLTKVWAKMDCDEHRQLGYPLNIAEMTAIKLYTDSKRAYGDLGWSQRTDSLHKWRTWDQLLMTALLKLHLAEKATETKHTGWLYSGLKDIQFKEKEKFGFFKTYVSTTKNVTKAQEFVKESEGMIMYISTDMQEQFINADVDWISCFDEAEVLFARSADINGYPAPTWKALYAEKHVPNNPNVQRVDFTSAGPPLVVPQGTTHTLPVAHAYAFSYIKLEEGATLTIEPWQPNNPAGGYLRIRCFGDCILEKDATITVSEKGYAGGSHDHPTGHGPGGGQTGFYCVAGGSHATQGGNGKCQDMSTGQCYSAESGAIYAPAILKKNNLSLGSGGGYIRYPVQYSLILLYWCRQYEKLPSIENDPDILSTLLSYSDEEGQSGKRGGGGLYLEIDGNLFLGDNSAFLARGGNATKLTGGAGSGGSICVAMKKAVQCTGKTPPRFEAQGGDNEEACDTVAQGAGGHGRITFYMNTENQAAFHQLRTAPSAFVLWKENAHLRRSYTHVCAYWCRLFMSSRENSSIKRLLLLYLLNENQEATQLQHTSYWLGAPPRNSTVARRPKSSLFPTNKKFRKNFFQGLTRSPF